MLSENMLDITITDAAIPPTYLQMHPPMKTNLLESLFPQSHRPLPTIAPYSTLLTFGPISNSVPAINRNFPKDVVPKMVSQNLLVTPYPSSKFL